MNEQEILQMLYRIDSKVDSIANELNKSITVTSVLQERIANNCSDITEIKDKLIPAAVRESIVKSKLWVYGSIGAGIISIIVGILLKVL